MMEKNNGVIGVQRSPEQTLQSNATTDGMTIVQIQKDIVGKLIRG